MGRFSKALASLLATKKMSQTALSKAVDIHQTEISRMYRGEAVPRDSAVVNRIAQELETDPKELRIAAAHDHVARMAETLDVSLANICGLEGMPPVPIFSFDNIDECLTDEGSPIIEKAQYLLHSDWFCGPGTYGVMMTSSAIGPRIQSDEIAFAAPKLSDNVREFTGIVGVRNAAPRVILGPLVIVADEVLVNRPSRFISVKNEDVLFLHRVIALVQAAEILDRLSANNISR